MYLTFFKSALDFTISLIAIIIFSPVFLFLMIMLFFTNKGRPFYYQERPGKNEKIFNIIKFKSMTDKTDSKGHLLPNALRITKVGTFLRKSSLDEIPQLINILKGDMSFIGPRPLRVHYLPYYTKKESLRHTIKPGVTGLAQVSGRNSLTWDDKLAKDVEYVNSISLWNDFIILLKTVKKVFSSEDIELDPEMLDLDTLRQ